MIHGGRVYVRHSTLTDGRSGTFANSTDLIEAVAGNTTTAEVSHILKENIFLNFKTMEIGLVQQIQV